NKSYAGHAILSRAVKTDDFACRDIRASRYIIDVEGEFRIVADRDFNGLRRRSYLAAGFPDSSYSSANARRHGIEHVVRCFSRLGDDNRAEKNGDACVSRREFND